MDIIKMPKKMPDREALCNILKRKRENNRKNNRSKHISIPLFKIGDHTLYSQLVIVVYINTGNVGMGHGLKYKRSVFFPRTKEKLTCDNERGMEYLKEQREKSKRYYKNHKEKILETVKKRYIENPKKYKNNTENQREYYLKNKDKINGICKEYYLKNKDKIISRTSEYYWKHREEILEKTRLKYLEKKEKRKKGEK